MIMVNPISIDIEVGSDQPNLLVGVTAVDNVDGDLTSSILVSGDVNVAVIDTYLIEYNVSDVAGNPAIQQTRTYKVMDTTPPEITVDRNAIELEVGSQPPDVLEGVSAFDTAEGDLTESVLSSGTIDVDVPGNYSITYEVSDLSGNDAESKTRTYIVADTTPPVIQVNPLEILVPLGATAPILSQGVSASDSFDGDLTGSLDITGTVSTSSEGDIMVSYDVVDNSGNAAVQQQRVYRVVATTTWEHDFEFLKGWNLLSFPGPPNQTDFLNSVKGLIWTLNGNVWVSVLPQDLTGQKGYWMYFDAPTSATLTGLDFVITTRVRPGWNLIGVRQDVSDLSSRSNLNPSIWTWNGTKYVIGNKELLPFFGHWVFAESLDEL